MRMLVQITLPPEDFNDKVRDGTIGETMQAILADIDPEAVYFTEMGGDRGAILIVDVENPSAIPRIAEPWFLQFNAAVHPLKASGQRFAVRLAPPELAPGDLVLADTEGQVSLQSGELANLR